MFAVNSFIIKRQTQPNLQYRECLLQLTLGLIARSKPPTVHRGLVAVGCDGVSYSSNVVRVPDVPIKVLK